MVKIQWYVVLIRLSLSELTGGLASPSWLAKGATAATCTVQRQDRSRKSHQLQALMLHNYMLYAEHLE